MPSRLVTYGMALPISRQFPPMPDSGSQSSGVPVFVPPSSSSSRRISTLELVGELELGQRAAAATVGAHLVADLDPGAAPERRAGDRRGEHLDAGLHGGADEAVVDAPDAARVEHGLGAEHEQLAAAQRTGDLVRAGEQPAEAAGEGADRRRVGAADEAHRAPGGVGEGERGQQRGEGEPAGVE